MKIVAAALIVPLLSGLSAICHAQSDEPARLDELKSDLLDATPGLYASPLLSASFLAGSIEANGVSFDFDGYLLRGGGALGYQIESIRLEAEATIGTSEVELDDAEVLAALGQPTEFDIFTASVTGNAYYDLPVNLSAYISDRLPAVMPYVGAGLGWVYLEVDGDDDSDLITQGMAGLGIRVTPRLTVDAGYRYLYIPRIAPQDIDTELDAHTAELRARYRF